MIAPPTLRPAQALAWRLRRQRLCGTPGTAGPADIAGLLCGLHAQVMTSAELSVLARTDALDRDAVRDALWRDRSLVKLWAARGTLHLVPARDLAVWLGALSTQIKFGNRGNADVDAICAAIGETLPGRVMTREELAAEVGRRTGSADLAGWLRSSWGSGFKAASFRGLICFAPPSGPSAAFTSPRTWIGDRVAEPAGALRDVVRAFVRAYAPVTPESIARWWIGPPRPVIGRTLLDTVADEIAPVTVDGRTAWVLAGDLADMLGARTQRSVRLLPAFDPWMVGAFREEPFLPPGRLGEIFRPQGWIAPVVLADGRVAGTWAHRRSGRRLEVTVEAFGPPSRPVVTGVEREAERLAAWFGRPLALGWT
jgi:hypothetical protein